MKRFFSSYNFFPRGYLYTSVGFLWTELPFYLLHNRGIFSSAQGLFAFSEVSPASGSAGPLVPASCRPFADRAIPSGPRLSTPCPLASSPPSENLQGQIHRQAPHIRLGEMARTTTIHTGIAHTSSSGQKERSMHLDCPDPKCTTNLSPWQNDDSLRLI